MTTAFDWLTDIAPEIAAATAADKKNRFIAMAENEVDSSYFQVGDKYNMAVAYYAAHLLALSIRSSETRGNLVREKEGDLERAYGATGTTNTDPNSTQYLETYNRLMGGRVPTFYMHDGSQNS